LVGFTSLAVVHIHKGKKKKKKKEEKAGDLKREEKSEPR